MKTQLARLMIFVLLAVPTVLSASGGPPSGMRLPDVDYDHGLASIKLGRFEQAIPSLLSFVERRPDDADAWNWLGYALRKMKRYSEAEKNYLQALHLDDKHRGAREYLGELYAETGQLDKARQQLTALEKLCPTGCEERTDLQQAIDAATGSP